MFSLVVAPNETKHTERPFFDYSEMALSLSPLSRVGRELGATVWIRNGGPFVDPRSTAMSTTKGAAIPPWMWSIPTNSMSVRTTRRRKTSFATSGKFCRVSGRSRGKAFSKFAAIHCRSSCVGDSSAILVFLSVRMCRCPWIPRLKCSKSRRVIVDPVHKTSKSLWNCASRSSHKKHFLQFGTC